MSLTSQIVFRMPGDKPQIFNLIQLTRNKINWQTHPVADLALIQLFPSNFEMKQKLESIAFPDYLMYAGDFLPSKDFNVTFLGYPFLDLKLEYFSPMTFDAYISSGLMTAIRADTKTKSTFFYLNVLSIQGCSGSGVYVSVKKAMFFGSKKTLMVGIMHGTYSDNTGGKLAAVTPLLYLKDWQINIE